MRPRRQSASRGSGLDFSDELVGTFGREAGDILKMSSAGRPAADRGHARRRQVLDRAVAPASRPVAPPSATGSPWRVIVTSSPAATRSRISGSAALPGSLTSLRDRAGSHDPLDLLAGDASDEVEVVVAVEHDEPG